MNARTRGVACFGTRGSLHRRSDDIVSIRAQPLGIHRENA